MAPVTCLECPTRLEISVEPVCVHVVVDHLRKQPDVVFCTPSIGEQNVFAVVILERVNELNALIEKIKAFTDVRDVMTSIWVEDILLCPENFELECLKLVTV